jgi:hypothetical protein
MGLNLRYILKCAYTYSNKFRSEDVKLYQNSCLDHLKRLDESRLP